MKILSQEKLNKIIDGHSALDPDNHDRVNAIIAISNIEISEVFKKSLDELGAKIGGLTYCVTTVIEQETKRIIASNEALSKSNDYYSKWNKILTMALIGVTLFVGLLQACVILKTSGK